MNERFLVDTNTLSELARAEPDAQVMSWFQTLERPATSAIVHYELARGIERMTRGRRRTFLESWFAELALALEILPVDAPVALAAARVEAAALRSGRPIEVRDLLIVATAQVNDCLLATRNVEHLRGHGVVVYDPFSDVRTL